MLLKEDVMTQKLTLPGSRNGFSLVELMVAITIGLFLAGGLTSLFVSNSRARTETEKNNRQLENGRYAMSLLADDLRHAGYYGEFDPNLLTGPHVPAAVPDPCLTSVADLKTGMPLHIQGYDNTAGNPGLSCLSDLRAGTDIVVIRRANTCVVGTVNCDGLRAGTPYFQVSRCYDVNELASGDVTRFYALDTATSNLTLHKRDCTAIADIRRYRTHIYFIANNAIGTDGIPTLKRAELGTDGTSPSFSIVPLVEGIENIQLEYGIDNNAINGGAPDTYTTRPGSFGACAGAACVANWQNVVAVRLSLLARSTEGTPGHADSKTYALGLQEDGTANKFGPFNDSIKRHAYQVFVKLDNPAGRKE